MGVARLINFNLRVCTKTVSVFSIFNIQVKDHPRAQWKTQITATKVFPIYDTTPEKGKFDVNGCLAKTSVYTKAKYRSESTILWSKMFFDFLIKIL